MDQAQNTSAEIGGSNGTMRYQTNDGTCTTIVDDSKEKLNQVINAIQKTLLLLHQLHLTVSSFTPDSQLHLLQRLLTFFVQKRLILSLFLSIVWMIFVSICSNSLVMELDNMTNLSDKCNIQVPMEVLNLIDDGKNPDEFTKDVLNYSCIARNQVTKGKTDAVKGLRKHLLEELQQTFPDEVDTYREIRASYAAVSC